MRWEKINITYERLYGIKLRVAQTIPPTSSPKLLGSYSQKEGVGEYSDEEFQEKLNDLEVVSK